MPSGIAKRRIRSRRPRASFCMATLPVEHTEPEPRPDLAEAPRGRRRAVAPAYLK
jgi:hypothetical protein